MILATRPVLLAVLRSSPKVRTVHGNSETTHVPEVASALAEACIHCARHSYRLLTECWIKGSFTTFDYFDTQYLFSAATILAISSLIGREGYQSDRDAFETAAEFLMELQRNGNFAAKEYCSHIDAMVTSMETFRIQMGKGTNEPGAQPSEIINLRPLDPFPVAEPQVGPSLVTAGMALAEPSIEEFMAQPGFNNNFVDTTMDNESLQGILWLEYQEDWNGGQMTNIL